MLGSHGSAWMASRSATKGADNLCVPRNWVAGVLLYDTPFQVPFVMMIDASSTTTTTGLRMIRARIGRQEPHGAITNGQ